MNSRVNKSSGVRDMTVGNPYKQIASFALPLFLSQLFQQLYNTADTLIVGNFLGTDSLAAVSSSGALIFLLVSFFNGISMGAGVVISRYFGAGDDDKVSRAIHTNLAFGIVSGLLLTVVGVLLTPTFLKWMNTDPEILAEAIEYFRFYFYGGFALVLYNICLGIMNALGDSRRPLRYLMFSSLLNILLDILFIGVFHFGVWSAALATVISQMSSVVLCMIHLLHPGRRYTVNLFKIRFHKDMFVEIIRNGIPAAVQNSVIGFANVIVQSQINTFGKFATAAYGTHAKVEGFAFLPITSFTMAITTFISQNLGAGKLDRSRKGARFGMLTSMAMAELIGVAVYIFAPKLIGLFDSTPEVVALGARQARTASLFYCLLAYSHAVASVFRGAGKAFVPMVIMLSIWCALRILYIYIVMELIGDIKYIYWAYPITWIISSLVYFVYYSASDWEKGFDRRRTNIRH